jgi:hypothetical protein
VPVRIDQLPEPPPPPAAAPVVARPASAAPRLRLIGAADGPAPWLWFVAFLVVWTFAGWLVTTGDHLARATWVLLPGLLLYWAMLPKTEARRPIPGWTVLPLIALFVALLALFALVGQSDERLVPIGYGVCFVVWIQVGLWMRNLR